MNNKNFIWILVLLISIVSVSALNITSPNNTVQSTQYLNISWNNTLANSTSYSLNLYNENLTFVQSIIDISNNSVYGSVRSVGSNTDYALIGSEYIGRKLYNLSYKLAHSSGDTYTCYAYLKINYVNESILTTTVTRTVVGEGIINASLNSNNTIRSIEVWGKTSNAVRLCYVYDINVTNKLDGNYFYDVYGANIQTGKYYINVSSLDSLTTTQSNINSFNLTANSLLNISIFNNGGSYLSLFNLSIRDLITGITINYTNYNLTAALGVVRYRNYNITANASSYLSNNQVYTALNMPQQNLSITLGDPNSLNLRIYNLTNLSLIPGVVTVKFYSPISAKTYVATNGLLNVTYLDSGVNEIILNNSNFVETRYSLNVVYGNNYSLDAYMVPSSSSTNVSFTFYDVNGAKLSNVFVSEYILANSSYVLAQSAYTDILGRVYFNYNSIYSYYYSYSKTGYRSNSFILSPPRESNYDITVAFDTSIPVYTVANVTGLASFNNVSKILSFSYTSSDSSYSSYSYTVSKIVDAKYTVLCSGSSVLIMDSFTCDITGYTGDVYVQGLTNNNKPFYGQYVNLGGTTNLSDVLPAKEASFLTAIVILIIIFAGLIFGVTGTLIFGIIGILVVFWLGLAGVITVGLILANIIVNIIIIVGFKRR